MCQTSTDAYLGGWLQAQASCVLESMDPWNSSDAHRSHYHQRLAIPVAIHPWIWSFHAAQ